MRLWSAYLNCAPASDGEQRVLRCQAAAEDQRASLGDRDVRVTGDNHPGADFMRGGVEIDLARGCGTADRQSSTGAGGDGVFVGVVKIDPADSAITIQSNSARRSDHPQ